MIEVEATRRWEERFKRGRRRRAGSRTFRGRHGPSATAHGGASPISNHGQGSEKERPHLLKETQKRARHCGNTYA